MSRVGIVKRLLAMPGLEVNARDAFGITPLMWAVRNSLTSKGKDNGKGKEVVRVMVEVEGIDLDARDNKGWTSLMNAVRIGSKEVVRLLVEVKGIDLDTRDNKGRSLEDEARNNPEDPSGVRAILVEARERREREEEEEAEEELEEPGGRGQEQP